jgi:large subunit ribosomal protein L3
MKMPGQTGSKKVLSESLRIMKLMEEDNILIVKGSVPGPNGAYVIILK